MKKLYKSNNRMICGVCAGVAEYFGIDPTIVRLIWAALALSGTGILLYIVAAIVMPENLDVMQARKTNPARCKRSGRGISFLRAASGCSLSGSA